MPLPSSPPFAFDPATACEARATAFDARAADLEDPRPHPTEAALDQLGCALMTELLDVLLSTALEDHLTVVCEAFIGGLHAGAQRLEREADRARDQMAALLQDFDGSEVADCELQDARRRADAAEVAAQALELVRDAAAAAYAAGTGESWSPWRGSVRASRATAAQIDAAHALRAVREARLREAEPGRVVAFRGAPAACSPTDASRIFDALNWARAQWPDMSLAITGAPGAERIARRWAAQKRVRLILARPEFDRHGRAAPFRANDVLMALEPVCVLTLAVSLEAVTDQARAFGPAVDLAQKAAGKGVRCVRVAARRLAA